MNVTNEGGAIAIGDFITTSSTAGHGMKATKAGGLSVWPWPASTVSRGK